MLGIFSSYSNEEWGKHCINYTLQRCINGKMAADNGGIRSTSNVLLNMV